MHQKRSELLYLDSIIKSKEYLIQSAKGNLKKPVAQVKKPILKGSWHGKDAWKLALKRMLSMLAVTVIYLIAGHAETNRGPFDMPEAESELTAGYHTEYSGIQFGFFYLAEYLNMFIIAAIATTMFLGGWQPLHIPGWDGFNHVMDYIPSIVWFFGKTFVCIFLALWVRWSFPRLRIDQLLGLEWKVLMPISLVNLMLMSIVVIW